MSESKSETIDKNDKSGSCDHSCAGCTNTSPSAKAEGSSGCGGMDPQMEADQDDYSDYEDGNGKSIGRAQFIRGAFALAAVCWGGMTLTPIAMYLDPPAGDEDGKQKVASLELCKVEDLPKGTGRNFRFGSFPAVIIHTQDGQLHAFKAICTHLGCTVQFRSEKQDIYCACHGGEYDAQTGKNIAGPPPKPLSPLKAEVVDGKIIVSRV